MYEVELKLRTAHNPVRERLGAIGATATGHVVQTDTYYAAPHRDFETTNEVLRTRREQTLAEGEEARTTWTTYKGPLVEHESKTRREEETVVENRGTIRSILDALGSTPLTTVEKERERFDYRDYSIVLDVVDGLREFVEIDREVPDSGIRNARDAARDVLRELGLDPTHRIRTSYLKLQLNGIDENE